MKINIRVILSADLLARQSGRKGPGKLLQVYPQFDGTPQLLVPDTAKLPMPGFSMKCYCPLHQEVHSVVFDVINE